MIELILCVPQLFRITVHHGSVSDILKTTASYILFKSFVIVSGGRVKSGLSFILERAFLNFAFTLYFHCFVIRQFHIFTMEPTYDSFVMSYMITFNECFLSA